jgi:acyl dehydratase
MGEVVQQRGLWFEELRTGVVYKHSPGRTISEADNTLFCTLTMNPQSLHLDAAFSETTEFGERLVNSLLTMSVLVGLSVGHLTQGTIIANLGFGDTRFPAPGRRSSWRSGCRPAVPARGSSSSSTPPATSTARSSPSSPGPR